MTNYTPQTNPSDEPYSDFYDDEVVATPSDELQDEDIELEQSFVGATVVKPVTQKNVNRAIINALKRLDAAVPEKWILKQEDLHKYDTQYQEHDKVIDRVHELLAAEIVKIEGK